MIWRISFNSLIGYGTIFLTAMYRKSPQPLANILSTDSAGLQRLVERTKALSRLNQAMQSYFPSPLNEHCRIANVKENVVIIQTDSSAWHTRLRYHVPQLLAFLRQQPGLGDLREIRIRVKPPEVAPVATTARRATLSSTAAEAIEGMARLIDDTDLRSALQRLAQRHRKKG